MPAQRIATQLDAVITVHHSENSPGQAIMSITVNSPNDRRYAEVFLSDEDRKSLIKILSGEEI